METSEDERLMFTTEQPVAAGRRACVYDHALVPSQ